MWGTPVAAWYEDDDIVGPIDYAIWLNDEGVYRLSMNGQGHLPITEENAKKLIAATIDKC